MRYAEAALAGAGALLALGFVVALSYEAWAIISGGPTISAITAGAIAKSPKISGASIFVGGAILGALVAHFTNWRA